MITTGRNLANTQTKLGHKWVIEEESSYKPNYIQLVSDPICSTAGCPKTKAQLEEEKNIVNYPDPDEIGLDEDMIHTSKSNAVARSTTGVTMKDPWKVVRDVQSESSRIS